MRTAVRYGRASMAFDLPDDWTVHVLAPSRLEPLADISAAVARALDEPIDTPPLADLARGRGAATVVVSDITRPIDNGLILPAILDRLAEAGIGARDVTILVATGLHRAPTPAETRTIVGDEALAAGVRVVAHRAREASDHQCLGTTDTGVPVWVDRAWLNAPLRIAVGLVEPHFMAGFSGGPKSICPGLAGKDTIMAFHGPRLLADPRSQPGRTADNPVYAEAWRVAELAGLPELCVQVVQSLDRQPLGVFAGTVRAAQDSAIVLAREALTSEVPRRVDVAITSNGGYPLDHVFYQDGKGLAAAAQVVRRGGGIVLVERNEEGLGSPEFAALLARCGDPAAWEPDLTADRAGEVDEWAIQELAKFAHHARLVNVCPDADDAYRVTVPIPTVNSVEEALDLLVREGVIGAGPNSAAVLPDGPYTLPAVRGE